MCACAGGGDAEPGAESGGEKMGVTSVCGTKITPSLPLATLIGPSSHSPVRGLASGGALPSRTSSPSPISSLSTSPSASASSSPAGRPSISKNDPTTSADSHGGGAASRSRSLPFLLRLLLRAALRAAFASPRMAERERERAIAPAPTAMDAGRRRLALDLRVLRLRAALTRLTWLAEDGSGVSETGVAGEDGSRGTANAEGGGPALRGVLLLLPTPGLRPRFGKDGLERIMVSRACAATALPVTSTTWARETMVKSTLAPSSSALPLASSSRALSSSVDSSAVL